MNHWLINNGNIILTLKDGTLYHPRSAELYEQKDKDFFIHADVYYAPLSETKLRFSELTAHVKPIFSYDKALRLDLYFEKKHSTYYVSKYANEFNDYIIFDGMWRYIDPIVESINSTIKKYEIDPDKISYQQYLLLIRAFINIGIEVTDDSIKNINIIKESGEFIPPLGLNANLYPYQIEGAKWLDFMIQQNCGSILGDEMGLGKTLQIITIMGKLKERKENVNFLVVCPVSLLENWRREISKFYPSLTTNIHYGSRRTGDINELNKYDVNIISYSCAITDAGMLNMTIWDLLIIDEAQNIKNPIAKRTKYIKQIKCRVPIAVTGTPFENHMTDIWSIVDFVMPGFLGNLFQFNQEFIDDVASAVAIEKIITPLLLRRRVNDVAKDLPRRIDIPLPIMMSDEEASLYENNRSTEELHEELMTMKLAKIQKLRTFCTHPCVYNNNYWAVDPTTVSTKYSRLCEILEEIFQSKEKVVIFTSFRRMVEMMSEDINKRFNVYTNYIDGSIQAVNRQKIVDAFSMVEGPAALILNPKAAGAGLNITCANHAIHYNLEWNPAIEDQASARIYRRGQEKTVFIYRLYYVNTLEEIINERIMSKRKISTNAVIGNKGDNTDEEYIIKAITASPFRSKIK